MIYFYFQSTFFRTSSKLQWSFLFCTLSDFSLGTAIGRYSFHPINFWKSVRKGLNVRFEVNRSFYLTFFGAYFFIFISYNRYACKRFTNLSLYGWILKIVAVRHIEVNLYRCIDISKTIMSAIKKVSCKN